jgi:hypothetical protein
MTSLQEPESGSAPRGVITQKKPSDVYTVMLAISLLAMIFACVFMWSEWASYKNTPPPPPVPVAPSE